MNGNVRSIVCSLAALFVLALPAFLFGGTQPRSGERSKREEKKPPFDPSKIDLKDVGSDEELAALVSEYLMSFTGLLGRPFEVSFQEVLLGGKREIETLRVKADRGGGAPLDTEYTGIRLEKLLGRGGAARGASGGPPFRRDARNLVVYGTGGSAAVIPMSAVAGGGVYLVWKHNGSYLSPADDGLVWIVADGGRPGALVQTPVLFDVTGEFDDLVPKADRRQGDGLSVVDQRRLFTLSIGRTPVMEAGTWSLGIEGLVDAPATLTYDDFVKLPQRAVYATLETISNPPGGKLIGNAVWAGVPMTAVFDLVKPKASVREVVFTCADGYTTSLTMEELRRPGVLLSHRVNGEPLLPEHGFPVRVVAPEKYGMKWAKWVTGMEFVDYDFKGFWETRGWSDYSGRDRPDRRFE
jgi:DMSO/TMAO reductase YedYZ molybdopterin-dependent catalytic subunit